MFTVYFVETASTENGIAISEVREKKIPASDLEDATIMAKETLTSRDGKVFYILRIQNGKDIEDFSHRLPDQIKEVHKKFFYPEPEETQSEAPQP